MTDPKNKTIGLHIPLTERELEDLKAWAEEHDKPLSHLIREVIFDAVAA